MTACVGSESAPGGVAQEITLTVSGWSCGFCQAATVERLSALAGVRTVEVLDWTNDAATVTVLIDPAVTGAEALTQAVAKDGFRAVAAHP